MKSNNEVLQLFIGNDLFQLMINESNIYYQQNKDTITERKKSYALAKMKKFRNIIITIGWVKKMS